MDQFQEESIYSKYLNFLSRFSKYDTIQYFGSLYEHLEIEMPEMNLSLPKQTLKKRKVKGKGEDGMVKKSTLDTMDNFNTFLSKSISEINGRMYQSLENSREFDEIINPEEEQGIREKEEEQEESEGEGCGEDENEDEEAKQKLQRSLSEEINKSARSEMKEETKKEQNEGKQEQRQNQMENVEVVENKDNSENSQKQDEHKELKQNKNEQNENDCEEKVEELQRPDNNEPETIQPSIQIKQVQQTHQQHQQLISHQNNPINLLTTQIPQQIPSLQTKQLNRCQSQTKLTKLPDPPTKLPFRMAKTSRTSSNLNLFQIQGQQKPVSVKKKNFSRMFIRKNSKSPPKELRSESVKKKKEKLLSNFFRSLNGEDQEKDGVGIE